MIPQTALAIRVAALCKRKPATPWSLREIAVYKRLVKSGFFDNLDDLALIEQYYAFERKKPSDGPHRGCHRRDLYTFLFNAAAELDRATAWREAHPLKPVPRKIIQMPLIPSEPFLAPTDAESVASLERFHQQFSAFKKVKAEMGR